jgi:hydrogenase expression/formation protein HypC
MCLAVPGKVISIQGDRARVSMEGVLYDAALAVVDDIHVGDYVIVHAGFVLEKLDEQEAAQELDAVRRYASGRVHTP